MVDSMAQADGLYRLIARLLGVPAWIAALAFAVAASDLIAQSGATVVPTPKDVVPGSITSEDVPYPYPVSYLPL